MLEERRRAEGATTSEECGAHRPGEDSEITRPGPVLMLKYWYGGTLPPRYSTWVLHDVTCRTWAVRHFARWILLIIAPLLAIYLLAVPGSIGLRLLTGLTFAGALLMFSLVNIAVDTDKRAVRAGYGYSDPGHLRQTRAAERHRHAVAARRERIAQRRRRRS